MEGRHTKASIFTGFFVRSNSRLIIHLNVIQTWYLHTCSPLNWGSLHIFVTGTFAAVAPCLAVQEESLCSLENIISLISTYAKLHKSSFTSSADNMRLFSFSNLWKSSCTVFTPVVSITSLHKILMSSKASSLLDNNCTTISFKSLESNSEKK